jgi:hypothetical protein
LFYALEAFITNSHLTSSAVEDFTTNFGEDEQGLKDYLADIAKKKLPYADVQEGFDATVVALKANEAINKRQKIAIQKDWFVI